MRGGTIQINWHDTKPVLTLDFHSLTGALATGGSDNDIKLWVITPNESLRNLPSASYQRSLSYHSSTVNTLRFSPSGEFFASGADGGELVIWKLQSIDDGSTWKVLKTLLYHRKDVLDLQWSPDGGYLITGSVDNSCIIWDVNKGSVHQILDAHLHYVQGVAWDPLGSYVASISSDRTCRIYENKPQPKHKGYEKINYVCQHVLTKLEVQNSDDSKVLMGKTFLFHDETLSSFFRRLSWSPDGSFLLVPAGIWKYTHASDLVNSAYIFSRKDLSRPAVQLPGASKPIVAIRFCPVFFQLRGSNSDGFFRLPYRVIFAVATLNSLYIYDSESAPPIAILAGLHYAAITDIAWSPDAKYLSLSSQDGYCSIVEFENDELGVPISVLDSKIASKASNTIMKSEVVDNVEIDSSRAHEADSKPEMKASEVKQSQATSAKTSGAKQPTKKRITPVAIK